MMNKICNRYYLSILALLAFMVLSTTVGASGINSDQGDLALGQSTVGTSPGWGWGSYPEQITDGKRFYSNYVGGVAFTGGHGWWEPCGERQAVVNFASPTEFNKVIIWHHGAGHIPAICDLSYWDGSNWVIINFQRTVDLSTVNWESDTLIFDTVTGSKVKYSFDNCGGRYWIDPRYPNDDWIEHGWIYEFEVYLEAPAPINHPPMATDNAYSIAEDTALTVPASEGLLANDNDVDGDTLTATLTSEPINGAVTINPDGSFDYMPNHNFYGTDSFKYKASDSKSESNEATVTITIISVNDCPTATDDSATVDEDGSIVIDVVANDYDIDDGDTLSVGSFNDGANGAVTKNDDGTLTYTPNAKFYGTDSFTYKVTDGTCDEANWNEATVTITIISVNDCPTATDDSATVDEDGSIVIDVVANDYDIDDGDTLSVGSFNDGANGAVTKNDDGTLTYTPNANYNGEDDFTYEISDGNGGTASAKVTITIISVNDAPMATNDGATLDEDSSVTIPVLANDIDVDGDDLIVTVTEDPTNGDLIENEDGTFLYTPELDYNGQDSFKYIVSDGEYESNEATVAITIDPVNDAPKADDDDFVTTEDSAISVAADKGVLVNDADIDGDELTASLSVEPDNGIAAVNPDGSFTYTPDANYNGEDSFTYEVSDNNGGTALAIVTITIDPINDAPVAVDDSEETDPTLVIDENTALDGIDVLANDYDPDEEEVLTVTSVTKPAHGVAEIKDNAINYKPNLWYSGEDSFQYTITDTTSLTATATVTITINDVIPSTDDICAFIQELPDDAFGKDASNQKKTFCNKLAEVGDKIANKEYRGAIEKLENDIRSKADGSLGGDKKNDWITDPGAQDELCGMIDTLLAALKAL